MFNVRTVLLGGAMTCAMSAPLVAQPSFSANAAYNSQFIWRGLTITNRPVVQPELTLTVPAGPLFFTAGAFANVELGHYNDQLHMISQNAGNGIGITEHDLTLEMAVPLPHFTLTVGAIHYGFPNAAGTTAAENTVEGYGKVEFEVPLSPSITVWNDVQKVRGAYGEVAFSQAVGPLAIGAVTGWNLGQAEGDGSRLGYFARSGFTHAEVSATAKWTVGMVTAAPTVHLILANDPKTFVVSPIRDARTKVWIGTSLRFANAHRKEEGELAAHSAKDGATTTTASSEKSGEKSK